MRPIILASASPRRETLLRNLMGDNFIVEPGSYQEEEGMKSFSGHQDPISVALYHSLKKARSVAKHHYQGVVIGADTVVVHDGIIFGKPHTNKRAFKMLLEISGKIVEVITGITIINCKRRKEYQTHEVTRVFMKDLDQQTIKDYVETGEPLDKAGAFGIQGKGAALIDRIEGDYNNVVGLPMYALARLLEKVGINIFELP